MHHFDSPTLQRQGGGTRLQTVYGLLATLLVLLTVGMSTGWAQAPTLAPDATSAIICATNAPTFDLTPDAPLIINYAVANVAWPGLNINVGNDITANFGDETVYHLGAAAIAAEVAAFPFTFYGTTHDLSQEGLYIGSNGFLRFENFDPNDNIEANEFGINAQAIPNVAGPNDAIYFLNIDLYPQAGEAITWDYDAGLDAIVITFTNVSQFNVNNPGVYPYNQVTVQAILYSDNAAGNVSQIDVNLALWPDPVYIPNAHTIGVEDNCGAAATAAGLPGAHNQATWANAGIAGANNGREQTTWEFNPVAGAAQPYCAVLVLDGGDNVQSTFDLNGLALGDDTYSGSVICASPVTLTGAVMNTPGTYNFYAIVEYDNCYQAQTDMPMSQVVVDPQPALQTLGPVSSNYCEGPTYTFTAVPLNATTNFTWAMGAPMVLGVDYTVVTSGAQNQNADFTFLVAGAAGLQAGASRTIEATETGPAPENCAITSSKTIVVYTTPAGTISTGSPSYCAANVGTVAYVGFATFSSTAGAYAWTLTNTGTTGATLDIPQDVSSSPWLRIPVYSQPLGAQTVTLNLTATNGICPFTTSTTFVINPTPTGKLITASPTTFCTNQANTFSLTGFAGNSYAWTFTGAGAYSGPDAAYLGNSVLNKTSVEITFTGAGVSSVIATESTPANCTHVNTMAFTVSATPAPTITGSNVPCQFIASAAGPPAFQTNPTPQQYVYTVAVPSGTNGYRWTVSNGGVIVAVNGVAGTYANPFPSASTFSTGSSNITVQWPTTGAGTVTVDEQGTGANACVGTFSYPVTVQSSPAAGDFSIAGPGVLGANPPCQNQATTATAYTVTGAGQHNIQLNGGTASAAAPYVISSPGPGTGDVLTGAGPGTFGSVVWTALTGTIIHDYAAVLGGCTSRETYAVTIQPLPTATISGLADVCGNSVGTYTATGLSAGITSYEWGWTDAGGTYPFVGTSGGAIATPGPGPAVTSTSITFNNIAATYFLGLRVIGPVPSGCAEEYVLAITITPQPSTPVLAGFAPTTVCDSTSATYTVTGTVGNDIRIIVVGGQFTAPALGTSIAFAATGGPDNFTVQWINSANGGTGFVTAIQYTTGVPSCTSATATSPTITIVRQPNTTVTGPSPVCGNDQDVVYTASNPQFINTYSWGWANDDQGTGFPAAFPAGTTFDGATNLQSVTVDWGNTVGTYFLTVEVVNTTGGANCTNWFTKTIVLNAQPAQPTITDGTPLGNECDSSVASFYTINGSGTPGNTIRLTITGGKITNAGGPATTTFAAAAATNFNVFWGLGGAGGVGTITAFEYSAAVPSCSSTVASLPVNVDPLPPFPTVTITPDPPGYCADAVPAFFDINNTAAYVGVADQYTAVFTWTQLSPTPGVMPVGFAHVQNNVPLGNTVLNEQDEVINWTNTPTIGFTATVNITITNTITGCTRFTDYTVVVKPRPAPVISGPVTACQEPTDPVGAPAGTVFVNPRYTYSTPQVAGNYYNWSITDGYIVAYSTDNGATFTDVVATSTMPGGSPIQNASQVEVVFFGPTPASVKVAEITAPTSPPGCQSTTPDYAVALDPLTPYTLSDPDPIFPTCFNDDILMDQNGSDVGHVYQLQISDDGGATFTDVTAASQNGTGGTLSWTVPTGAGTQVLAPGFYDFRAEATSPMGCISYTQPMLNMEVVPNPDTIPMSPLTDTICDASLGIPFTVGPTVEAFTFYDLEREGPAGVWTSYETYFDFAPPPTIVLTDMSNPPGAAAPAGIVYNYRVVAVSLGTLCSTILDTAVITIVDPCVPVIGAVNTPPGYNLDEVCIYGGFEEHLVTYVLASGPPCLVNTPGIILNWYTSAPAGSLVTGAVREQGGDTAVVEWYTTGGTQIGYVIAQITLPAAFGGCVAEDILQVRVYPLPVPNIHTGPANVCQNQQGVQYTATLELGDTYLWEVVGGLIATPAGATGAGTTLSPSTYSALNANVITINWLDVANPTASITLTQTTPVGCLNRTTRTITVNPTPTPSINGPAAPCGLDVVTYTTQNNAPNNSYQWTVTFGPGTIQSGATTNTIQFLTGAATTSTQIQVTETIIATNCSKSNIFNINPALKPTPVITRVTPLPGNIGNACLSTPMTYSTPTVVGNSVLWTIVGGTITSATNAYLVSVTWNVLGNQSLTVTEWVDLSQCTTAVTQQVVVEAIPSPSITGPVLVCGSTSSNYSTPLVAGHTYLWSLTTPADGNFVGSTTSNSSTILWNNPTPGATFAAQVNVEETATLAGCSNTALLGVTVHRQPTVPVITRTSPTGNANQACTSDQITYDVDNNTGSSYQWTVTGGAIIGSSTTSTVVVQWTVAGNNTLTLTETTTGNTACFATGTLNVTVENKPTPTVTGPTVVCGNAISTYSTPAVAGDTYMWTISSGTGTITSSATTNSINVTWGNPTPGNTFTSTVTVVQTTGTGNCTGTANATVTIHRQPTVPVITRNGGNDNQACTSELINYEVDNNAGSTFQWTVTGGAIIGSSTTSVVLVQWTVAGNNTLTLTETTTDNTACLATATLNVAVENKPVPTVTGPAVVCGNATSNYSTPAVAGDTYQWSIAASLPPHGTITSSTTTNAITILWNNPVVNTTFTALVTVIQATASGNCTGEADITVTVHRQPIVPVITRTSPTGNANQACTSDQITYDVDNNTGSTFQWTVTGGAIIGSSTTSTVLVQWTVAGNNTLTVTETTAGNTACLATATLNVAVENKPAPTVTGPAVVCGNATSNYSTPAVAGDTYLWTIADGSHGTITSSTTTSAITVMWNNPAAGNTFAATVTVVQTTPSGNCTGTANIAVTVHRQPTTSTITRITSGGLVNEACTGQMIEYSIPDNAGSSYNWTVTGANINSGQGTNAITVTWNVAGNGMLTVVETTTDNTACSATSTQSVTVEATPTPAITGPSIACGNTTSTFSTPNVVGNSYAWTLNDAAFGTFTSATNANSANILWNNPAPASTFAAIVTVTETTPTGNCVTTTDHNVTVYTQPTVQTVTRVAPTGNSNQACQGENITYSVPSNSGSTYVWTITGGNNVSIGTTPANNVIVEWTQVGNGSVSVTETTDANTACSATSTLNVTVEAKPNPTITGATVVCGNSVQSYSTPAVAGDTYLWMISAVGSFPMGTITSSTTTNAITVLWENPAPGTTFSAVVTVIQTTPSGNCTGTASVTVTVHRQPVANAITRVDPPGNANQACSGDNITYAVTNDNAGSTFSWTVTGGNFMTAPETNSVQVEWTAVGNQTLTVTESTTTLTTCSFTNTLNVTVEAKPTPVISGPTVVCINTIHTHSTPFVVGNTYSWAITPASGSPVPVFAAINGWNTSNSITLQWIQTGLHTLTVTETSNSGNCVGTASIQVRVNPIPTPAITSATGYGSPITARPGVVCAGSTHTYSVSPTPGNVFFWTVSGGSIVSGQNTPDLIVTWGSVGMGSIGITETIPGSTCSGTDLDSIDKRRQPTPLITGNINPCANSTTIYTTPFVIGNTYTWTVNGPAGTTSFVVSGNPNQFSVTWGSLVYPATFAGSVSVNESVAAILPAGSCATANTLNLTVRPNPPAVIVTASQNPVCASDLSDVPPTINGVTYTTPTVPGGGITYTWSISPNGTIVSGQGTTSVLARWTNTTVAPTTGTITVVLTTPFGCTNTGSFVATINPIPNPVITGPTSVCQNTIHNYSTAGIPGNSYTWTLSGGNVIRSGQGTPNITVEWTIPGPHTLSLTETIIATGCTATNTITVTVNPIPTVEITASGLTTFCQGGDVTLTAPLGFASYIWSTGQSGRSIVVRSTGTYYVLVTDVNGCSNTSDTITVNVFPSSLPIISTTGPTTFCEGGSITLSGPSGFPAYLWSTGATTQSIVVTQSGTYTVTVADNNGCTGTSTEVDVFVNPGPTPVLTVIGTTTICDGDSVEVRAPAGYPTYLWVSTSLADYGNGRTIFIKTSDTVYVIVTDVNGCPGTSDIVRVVLSSVTPPTVTASGATSFCQGGSVTLEAPTGFANYIWSNGSTDRTVTVTESGTYTVTVTDNSLCAATSNAVTVTVFPTPAKPEVERNGDILTAIGPATTHQWYLNGTLMPGATTVTLSPTSAGAYRVEITDDNGCSNISDPFEYIITGVDDVTAGYVAEMRIFPNPTNGQFTIETEISQAGPVRIEIVNAIGESVLTLNEITGGGKFRTSSHLGDLASGVYSVVLTSGNERWTVRLVRQ